MICDAYIIRHRYRPGLFLGKGVRCTLPLLFDQRDHAEDAIDKLVLLARGDWEVIHVRVEEIP